MAVANTLAMDSEVAVIAFARNGTKNPDVFMLVNIGKRDKQVAVKVSGSDSKVFEAFRTTDDKDRYKHIGRFSLKNGSVKYKAPAKSATTFFAK